MPGGVSSPVRAFKSVGGNPVVFDKVKGAYAWDVDGNKYIDYVGTWGPAILGHADDDVLDAVKATMDKGKFLFVCYFMQNTVWLGTPMYLLNISFMAIKLMYRCIQFVSSKHNRNFFRCPLPARE